MGQTIADRRRKFYSCDENSQRARARKRRLAALLDSEQKRVRSEARRVALSFSMAS